LAQNAHPFTFITPNPGYVSFFSELRFSSFRRSRGFELLVEDEVLSETVMVTFTCQHDSEILFGGQPKPAISTVGKCARRKKNPIIQSLMAINHKICS
jgi:hypothetical protein